MTLTTAPSAAPPLWQMQAAAEMERRRRGVAAPVAFSDWYRTTLAPGWGVPPHLAYLCSVIDRLVSGEVMRLCVSMPPGHAKSDTITRRLPVYWGERHGRDRIVVTGYNQTFAERQLSGPTRELARERGILAPAATALSEWAFTSGARLIARGTGSAPTGVNPISLLIVDDPISSAAQAHSEAERAAVWEWWTGSIVQRFWPKTRAVVIATRWHEDDLIGRLMQQEAALAEVDRTWTFVNLPALALPGDVLGRAEGEALWPEAKPAAFLHALRAEMGGYAFEALFQGNPTPREGSLFKVDRLRYCEAREVPPLARECRAWDLAATDGAGDFTAGVRLGQDAAGTTYVLDVVRGQWGPGSRNAAMRRTAEADGPAVPIRVPQDPGQAGVEQAAALARMLSGFIVSTTRPTGSKEVRASPFAAQVETGNVVLVRGPWNAAFVEEARAFPLGTHDDQIDAAADAFAAVAVPAFDLSRLVL